MNKISQEIFGNQPIFNLVSELVLLRSEKNFKPCIQDLVGTSSKLPASTPALSIWEYHRDNRRGHRLRYSLGILFLLKPSVNYTYKRAWE